MLDRICVNKILPLRTAKMTVFCFLEIQQSIFMNSLPAYIHNFLHEDGKCHELCLTEWKAKTLCPVLCIKPEWIGMTEYIIQNNEQLHEK